MTDSIDPKELLRMRDLINAKLAESPISSRNQLVDEKIIDDLLNSDEKYRDWIEQKKLMDEMLGRQIRIDQDFPETSNQGKILNQLRDLRDRMGFKYPIRTVSTKADKAEIEGSRGITDPNIRDIKLNPERLSGQNQYLKTGAHEIGHIPDMENILEGRKFNELSDKEKIAFNEWVDKTEMGLKKNQIQAYDFLRQKGKLPQEANELVRDKDTFIKSLSPSDTIDLASFRHHEPENKVIDYLAGPEVKQMKELGTRPFEKRALLNYIRKFGGSLKGLAPLGIGTAVGMASGMSPGEAAASDILDTVTLGGAEKLGENEEEMLKDLEQKQMLEKMSPYEKGQYEKVQEEVNKFPTIENLLKKKQ